MTNQFDMINKMQFDPTEIDSWPTEHPLTFSARANSEDDPTFNQAMGSPDCEGFIAAMHHEIEQLESVTAWNVVPRSKAIKLKSNILASTWVFKRKRYPDGSVKKLKARIYVRGDQQVHNVDYFDTFSLVVQWSTIRLMFILSIMLGLKTVQVDYTLAFVQAPAEPGTYVEMPRLFEIPGMVLELNQNLYGQCESRRKFYDHLKKGLEDRGLKRSPMIIACSCQSQCQLLHTLMITSSLLRKKRILGLLLHHYEVYPQKMKKNGIPLFWKKSKTMLDS